MIISICTSALQSQITDLLPCNNGQKSQLIYALQRCYGLMDHFDHVKDCSSATLKEMSKFHSIDYLNILLSKEHEELDRAEPVLQLAELAKRHYEEFDISTDDQEQWFNNEVELYRYYSSMFRVETQVLAQKALQSVSLAKYGLQHDCPKFPFISMYLRAVIGATLSLLDNVNRNIPSISINWDGGRHHAFKQQASGFCYVNDIVLLIQALRRKSWRKVTYVDFDLHFGDGVSRAFKFSENVQTISLHLYEPGFFPGTGSLKETENSKQTVNIPLLHGMDDQYLSKLMSDVVIPLIQQFDADCVVIQCGCDGLGSDKYNEWQLSIRGLTEAIIAVLNLFKNKQTFLLGGGGYNELLVARFYTYLTSKVLCTFGKLQNNPITEEPEELIRDHEFIELYKKENYRFWCYDNEGELKSQLLNDNQISYIHQLREYYHL